MEYLTTFEDEYEDKDGYGIDEWEVRVEFDYVPGYPSTRWEPGEPDSIEITNVEVRCSSEDPWLPIDCQYFDDNLYEEIEHDDKFWNDMVVTALM